MKTLAMSLVLLVGGMAFGKPPTKKLGEYLAGAVAGTMKTEKKKLSEADVKALLAELDLDAIPDGGIPRCPPREQVELTDKAGKVLGTFGSCGVNGTHWDRFDAPNGEFGGPHYKKK